MMMARLLSWWFRYSPIKQYNEYLWDHICLPYVNWRELMLTGITRNGIRFRCDSRDVIQQYIFYFGIWEPHITSFIKKRLKRRDIFIDIGANIGYYSLMASKYCDSIVAIEASPKICAMLKDNITRNEADNVRTVNVAISEKIGEAKIYQGPPKNIGGTTIMSTIAHANDMKLEATVRTAPLVNVLTADEMANARLVKIDVEGSEYPIIKNILKNVDKFRTDVEIILELSPEGCTQFGVTLEDVLRDFSDSGFRAYEVRNVYTPDDYLNRVPALPPRRLTDVPKKQIDLIFSRQKSATL